MPIRSRKEDKLNTGSNADDLKSCFAREIAVTTTCQFVNAVCV